LPQSGHPGIVAEALRYRERAMGGCSSQSVTRSLVIALAAVVVACSGGSGGGEKASPKTSPPSSSTPPATIDLSKPIPGGSLHGTPRPPLENTGTDYVAILKSLTWNFRWLTENPDVSALADLYVPDTETYNFQASFFSALVQNGWRGADDGYRVVSADVVDARQDSVALRVQDEFAFERIVDAEGTQVGQGRARSPALKAWNVLLTPDSSGHWRVASWAQIADTVQL
jgi:hypothetical protein